MNTVNKCPLLPIENVYKIYFGALWYEPISCQNAGVWYELCRYWWHEVKNANIKQVYHYLYIPFWCFSHIVWCLNLSRRLMHSKFYHHYLIGSSYPKFWKHLFHGDHHQQFCQLFRHCQRGSSGWHHHKVFASKGGVANIPRWGSRIEPENDGTGKMTFPWKRAAFSGFMLIFRGVIDVSFATFLIHTVLLTSSKLIGWRVLEVFQP